MPYAVYWIAALAACVLGLSIGLVWALRRSTQGGNGLPAEWLLTARPVFTTDERRVFRLLREALPQHVVLSKLPLVRFCQPTEAKEVRYWFDLLGAANVTFAICSTNGRVLAAIDLEGERGVTPRSLQIKQAVLSTCRVRYLRCGMDQLPSIAELQRLVPESLQLRSPRPAPALPRHRSSPREDEFRGDFSADARGEDWHQPTQPQPLWQEARFDDDAFDSRQRPARATPDLPPRPRMSARDPGAAPARAAPYPPRHPPAQPPRTARHHLPVLDDADEDAMLDDIVGVVVDDDDTPRYSNQRPFR